MNQLQAVFSAPDGNYLDNPISHPFTVHLGGEKLGYKMEFDLRTEWDKNGDYSHLGNGLKMRSLDIVDIKQFHKKVLLEIFHALKDLTAEDLDVYEEFKKQFDQRLMFTSPYDPDEAPIITLAESVSSWNIGDEIVIGKSSN